MLVFQTSSVGVKLSKRLLLFSNIRKDTELSIVSILSFRSEKEAFVEKKTQDWTFGLSTEEKKKRDRNTDMTGEDKWLLAQVTKEILDSWNALWASLCAGKQAQDV